MWKYFLVGVIVSLLSGFIMSVPFMYDGYLYSEYSGLLYALPGGVLAGYAGGLIDKKIAKTTLHKLGIMLITIVLSILFSFGSFFLFFSLAN